MQCRLIRNEEFILNYIRKTMHIPPFDNDNKPIIDIENNIVPNIYFNIVKLSQNEEFSICLKNMKYAWFLQQVLLK